MTEEDPCYKGECRDVVADYDYEVGKILEHDQLEAAQEVTPLEARPSKVSSRFMMVAGLVLAIIIGGAYLAGTQRSSQQEVAEPTPVSDSRSVWVDSLDPSISPVPVPQPNPSIDPGVTQTRCATTSDSKPSYQATVSVVVGPYGPVPPPFGFVPVAGPASLPPVFVETEKLCWWWNWRSGPNGCYEYFLDQNRLN